MKGYLPEALVNYLALLGSSFAEAREVMSPAEMIEAFSLERASKSGAVFDEEKLRWLNAIYIRNLTVDDLSNRLWPFLRRAGYQPEKLDPSWMKQIIETVRDELTALADIGEHIAIFFDGRYQMTSEAAQILDSAGAKKVVLAFGEYLESAVGSPIEMYAAAIRHAREKSGLKGRDLFMPVRAALTGKVQGPELERVFAVIGKESAARRLKQAYP